jgi:hypothetical protein
MKTKLAEAFGWYGVVAIVSAYALINFNILSVNNIWYQTLNLTGALGIIFDAFNQRNWQPAVLNIIWAAIATIAIIKILW